jgi:hypothetical protein
LSILLAFSTAEPAQFITDHQLAFFMAEPTWTDGQTDEQTNEFSSRKSRGWSLSFLWFFALRLATKQKRVLGFKFLGFLEDGFEVKEKKRQARVDCVRPSRAHTRHIKINISHILNPNLTK